MDKNSLLISRSGSDTTKFGKEQFAAQSGRQRVFSAIWALESEINDGGFLRYFLDSSAATAPFAVGALNTIAAPRTAGTCKCATSAAFPAAPPTVTEAIQTTAWNLSEDVLEKLLPLDQEFFGYPHHLTNLLFAQVSGHPEEFGTLPQS